MKVAILTIEQHRQLIGQELSNGQLYNPVLYKSGHVILSEQEISATTNTSYLWVKSLPLVELSTLTLPVVTPPTMTGLGLLIPQKANDPDLDLFPNNQFKLGGFVINFTTTAQGLAIDLAYLGWTAFRAEQLNPINDTVKKTFSKLWDTVAADYEFSVANPSQSKIIQL